MALSFAQEIVGILKVFYKDGVGNLLFRNSPLLRKMQIDKVDTGLEYRFACLYGRGGAVAADATVAQRIAAVTARNAEFKVPMNNLFSAYTVDTKELDSSRNKRGAYMTIAGNRLFAAMEAMRKTLATALYGMGYGEFYMATAAGTISAGPGNTIVLNDSAVMALDVGSEFVVSGPFDSTGTIGSIGPSVNTVTAIDDSNNTITFTATASDAYSAGDFLCLNGCRDGSDPALPVGLAAWIPNFGQRRTALFNSWISRPFFGVNRSVSSRLYGQYTYQGDLPAGSTNLDVLKDIFRKTRRAGGMNDILVMNDARYAKVMGEMTAVYQQQTNGGADSQRGTSGYGKMNLEFSTSFLEAMIDDPYCPYEKAYCLDSKAVALATINNAPRVIEDGIANNEPGKADVLSEDGNGYAEEAHRINIDDLISVKDGIAVFNGDAAMITARLYANFVVYNPSHCGVAEFTA